MQKLFQAAKVVLHKTPLGLHGLPRVGCESAYPLPLGTASYGSWSLLGLISQQVVSTCLNSCRAYVKVHKVKSMWLMYWIHGSSTQIVFRKILLEFETLKTCPREPPLRKWKNRFWFGFSFDTSSLCGPIPVSCHPKTPKSLDTPQVMALSHMSLGTILLSQYQASSRWLPSRESKTVVTDAATWWDSNSRIKKQQMILMISNNSNKSTSPETAAFPSSV